MKATLICCPLSEPSAVTRVVRGQPLPSLRVTATVSYPPAPRAGSHSPRGARLVVGPGGVQRGGCVWPGHSTGDPRPRAHASEPHRVLAAGGAEAIGAGAGGLPRGDGRGGPPQDVLLRVSAITEDEPHAPGGGVPTSAQSGYLSKSQENENINFINYYKEFNLSPQIGSCLKLSDMGFAVICNLTQRRKK